MTAMFEIEVTLPERNGRLNIYNEGVNATAGHVTDLLPKLQDGTYGELVIRFGEMPSRV